MDCTSLTCALIQASDTALRTASFNGHKDVVRLLITRGATVDIKDKVSRSCDISVLMVVVM